jgi:hypothetical protein
LFWLLCNLGEQGYWDWLKASFDHRLGLAKTMVEAGANPTTICSVNYHTALEILCGPITYTKRKFGHYDQPESDLEILRMISEEAPHWLSTHSSGKPLLFGAWSDFVSPMQEKRTEEAGRWWSDESRGERKVYLWVNQRVEHVVSASLIILQAGLATSIVGESYQELRGEIYVVKSMVVKPLKSLDELWSKLQ